MTSSPEMKDLFSRGAANIQCVPQCKPSVEAVKTHAQRQITDAWYALLVHRDARRPHPQ